MAPRAFEYTLERGRVLVISPNDLDLRDRSVDFDVLEGRVNLSVKMADWRSESPFDLKAGQSTSVRGAIVNVIVFAVSDVRIRVLSSTTDGQASR